jgi:hypothetical protein
VQSRLRFIEFDSTEQQKYLYLFAGKGPTPSRVGGRRREVGAEPVLAEEKGDRWIRWETFFNGATRAGGNLLRNFLASSFSTSLAQQS